MYFLVCIHYCTTVSVVILQIKVENRRSCAVYKPVVFRSRAFVQDAQHAYASGHVHKHMYGRGHAAFNDTGNDNENSADALETGILW